MEPRFSPKLDYLEDNTMLKFVVAAIFIAAIVVYLVRRRPIVEYMPDENLGD